LVSIGNNHNGESATIRGWNSTSTEGLVLGLLGFPESKAVELDRLRAGIVTDNLCGLGNFLDGKLI
jgi:hypothetical protein